MEKPTKLIPFGVILGLSLVIAALLVSGTLLDIKELNNVISISGSAKLPVTSDSARWTGNFSRTAFATNLKSGYEAMKKDEGLVAAYLDEQGFAGKYEISPVYMYEIYKSDAYAPKEYNLTQSIEVKSDDVEKVKNLVKNIEKVIAQGVIFSSNPVEYYYSKLPDVRVSLLPEAIKDAKARAQAIADSSGAKVDDVKSVAMGVVQVMPLGAIEVSDYGSYDTSSIDKEVMITVKVTFGLK
ncbi:MAG: SIMPL domain-containing protein [Patescibacteria group bacterium]|jgi:hypothetical protein|nr:SIMPL domain-containing protein [bacterium]HQC50173.1 SIMPL domain-containing protein [bacterium]